MIVTDENKKYYLQAMKVEFLTEQECDLIQGYFYAKPMPVAVEHTAGVPVRVIEERKEVKFNPDAAAKPAVKPRAVKPAAKPAAKPKAQPKPQPKQDMPKPVAMQPSVKVVVKDDSQNNGAVVVGNHNTVNNVVINNYPQAVADTVKQAKRVRRVLVGYASSQHTYTK